MSRVLIAVVGFCLFVGCSEQEDLGIAPNIESSVSDADVARAATQFRQGDPIPSDLAWLESFDAEQRQEIIRRLPEPDGVEHFDSLEVGEAAHSHGSQLASWDGEWIEARPGGGRGCTTTAFWNSSMCGGDRFPDKTYYFPCSNRAGQNRIRIWSSSWQVRWLLGSGVSARVYDRYVLICIGYWSLYRTYTNPYTLLGTTYIYW